MGLEIEQSSRFRSAMQDTLYVHLFSYVSVLWSSVPELFVEIETV